VAENKKQVALKVEQLKGSQPSGSSAKEQPSKSVKKESWYEMRDDHGGCSGERDL
jgi:hypothetical protein